MKLVEKSGHFGGQQKRCYRVYHAFLLLFHFEPVRRLFWRPRVDAQLQTFLQNFDQVAWVFRSERTKPSESEEGPKSDDLCVGLSFPSTSAQEYMIRLIIERE